MSSLGYGRFSDDGREYRLERPDTPRPWHHYLVNDQYLANITQHGTGASHWQPLGEGLRTNLTEDRDGGGGPRVVYLRDAETGRYWSLSGAPGHEARARWSSTFGLGWHRIESAHEGVSASWTMFVPLPGDEASADGPASAGNVPREGASDPCEIWRIEIRNESDRPRRISVIPFVEMHLTGGSTLMDFISVLGGFYDEANRAVFGINNCVKFPDTFKAVLAVDTAVESATVSRDEFIGMYRDLHNPVAVERDDVHNPQAGTEWLGASLRSTFALEPGETATVHAMLGVIRSVEQGRALIAKHLADGAPQRTLDRINARAEAMCSRLTTSSPDEQFDRWVNVRLKHQLQMVARWGRVIGRGYRDVLQDAFAHRLTEPARARACLTEVFAKQFPDGRCIRAWRLPNAQLDLQHYADSPSWMVMALSMYLKETADYALLDERVPFLNPEDPYAAATSDATMWAHLVLAQRHLLEHRGRHGLSKIYYGDWCDTMNGVGQRGEGVSVMLSMQVKWGCDLLAELASHLLAAGRIPAGETADSLEAMVKEMGEASGELSKAINAHAWDGQWYVRAFDDDGEAVGSANGPASDKGELRIFLNPQSWAVIAGVADADRAASALGAVYEHCDTGYGMVLSYPQSTFLKPRIGQMSTMTPGFYENGSVYTHGNCFWAAALAMAGRGEEAWRAIRDVLPDTDNKPNADGEPFVIPNMYIGPVVERRKQRNLYLSGWRTGSAAWLYVICVEWILGARAEYAGLRIDPHLPRGWKQVTLSRPFRGDEYEIAIESDGDPSAKVVSVTLDGEVVSLDGSGGAVLTPAGDGGRHAVRVVMRG